MYKEIEELLRRARDKEQRLTVLQLQVNFGDLGSDRRGLNVKSETRIKQIQTWLKERGYKLRKLRSGEYGILVENRRQN